MKTEDILDSNDEVLKKTLFDLKEKLFNLYQKLDLSLLRLGIMALSIHDNNCTLAEVFDTDDLLLRIQKIKYSFNIADVEFSERKKHLPDEVAFHEVL